MKKEKKIEWDKERKNCKSPGCTWRWKIYDSKKKFHKWLREKKEIISEINDVIEDCDEIEILDFIGVDNVFDEENPIVEINCGVDKLFENYGSTKIDAIFSVKN